MTNEPEMIGVDVWAAVTIYVPAKDDEEAAAIVAERYAGKRDDAETYDHMSGEDLPMEDEDFMSSAMTFYGLCNDSELFAALDPVRDAAPDMLAALRKAIDDWPTWDDQDEPVNGGDLVEWFGNWRKSALAAIAKAEGGKA